MEPRFITTDLPANGQAERTRGYVRTYGIMSILGIGLVIGPIRTALETVNLFGDKELWLLSNHPTLGLFPHYCISINVVSIALGIWAASRFFNRKRGFTRLYAASIVFFIATMALAGLWVYESTLSFGGETLRTTLLMALSTFGAPTQECQSEQASLPVRATHTTHVGSGKAAHMC